MAKYYFDDDYEEFENYEYDDDFYGDERNQMPHISVEDIIKMTDTISAVFDSLLKLSKTVGKKSKEVISSLNKLLDDTIRVKKVFSYKEAIKYFTENELPEDIDFTSGAILVRKSPNKYIIFLMYLKGKRILTDSSGTILGQKIFSRKIDFELQEVLGDNQLIIVK